MNTITCPLCRTPVAAWWKTMLHPGCRFYWTWERNRRLVEAMPILRSGA